MSKFVLYLEDCYHELMYKVTWPTWEELQSSSIVVFVASIITSLIIFGMDSFFNNLMNFIYSI